MELRKTWKYHLLLGIIILAMDYFRDYVYRGESYFLENFEPAYILLKITFLLSFYSVYCLNYAFICPRTLSKKKIALFFLAVVLMPFVFAGIRYTLEEILVYHIFGFHNYSDNTRVFWYYIFDNTYYTIKSLLFSTSMYLLFMYIKNINSIHRLEIERQSAELQLLKGQLEPHFLFNTLNAFYTELIDKQPETAKSIYKLSELLRYITYEAKSDFMSLQKELAFIEDYIYFYRKRFEHNLFLDYEIKGTVAQQRIPSLVLIHFIENTFKHGILNHKDHPARILIEIEETHICVYTKNRISKGQSYSQKGIGRENLVKRLDVLFPKAYVLNYKTKETYFEAFLQLPLTQESYARA
ncbi:sensor histidine kinase [Spongiimicrobium salis]|uniref:sensor histidine kinase n=1 Tax=Spongiimicrobium salis TaxID=1667022 RepID=UPI00374CE7A8